MSYSTKWFWGLIRIINIELSEVEELSEVDNQVIPQYYICCQQHDKDKVGHLTLLRLGWPCMFVWLQKIDCFAKSGGA